MRRRRGRAALSAGPRFPRSAWRPPPLYAQYEHIWGRKHPATGRQSVPGSSSTYGRLGSLSSFRANHIALRPAFRQSRRRAAMRSHGSKPSPSFVLAASRPATMVAPLRRSCAASSGATDVDCDRAFQARELAHAGGADRLRLRDRAHQLRAALGARLVPDAAVERPTAGAATCSRLALAIQNLLWGAASRSPARSPTGSARRACCASARSSMRSAST